MKILHFADLHLGVESYGRIDPATGLSSRLIDFLAALDQVVAKSLPPVRSVPSPRSSMYWIDVVLKVREVL